MINVEIVPVDTVQRRKENERYKIKSEQNENELATYDLKPKERTPDRSRFWF